MSKAVDIDIQKIRSEYGHNFIYILKSLVIEIRQDLKQLKTSLRQSDQRNARYFLHQLIGSSKLLQSDILTNALREVQREVHQFKFDANACIELEKLASNLGSYLHQELKRFGLNHVLVFVDDIDSVKAIEGQMNSLGNKISYVSSAQKLEEELMMNLPELLFVSEGCKKNLQSDIQSEFLGTSVNFFNKNQHSSEELMGKLNRYLEQRFL